MADTATEHGKFITIPKEEYDSMRRTIEILEDARAMKMVEESEKAIQEGKTKSLDELKNELGF